MDIIGRYCCSCCCCNSDDADDAGAKTPCIVSNSPQSDENDEESVIYCTGIISPEIPGSVSDDVHNEPSISDDDEFELDPSMITLGDEIGRGRFGRVVKGNLNGRQVAVKFLIEGNATEEYFLQESKIMRKFESGKLLCLFGVNSQPPICIVTEFMENGNLLDYMRSSRGRDSDSNEHADIASQVATGMQHMNRKKYIHGDLRAANILVGSNKECKIANFKNARFVKDDVYRVDENYKFPIKWSAPECLDEGIFKLQSDVWSFGILLYEIVTKGNEPYHGISNWDVFVKLQHGYRMKKPDFCSDEFYEMMSECWNNNPEKRPDFSTLQKQLRKLSHNIAKPVTTRASADGKRIYAAVYSYAARRDGEVSFARGDQMIILREENEWCQLKLLASSITGRGPRSYIAHESALDHERWYAGKIGRQEAERQFNTEYDEPGTFLIRDSIEHKGEYILTMRVVLDDIQTIVHRQIYKNESERLYIHSGKEFDDIRKLVDHYKNVADELPCKLLSACFLDLKPPVVLSSTDLLQIRRCEITLCNEIADGSYATVSRGIWKKNIDVAVKILKPECFAQDNLIRGAEVMKNLRHLNLHAVLAVVVEEPIWIVTEFMQRGNLLSYLKSGEGEFNNQAEQVDIAMQVASGMIYLHEKGYVHRNLQSKNVLVGQNGIYKITDFGLSRFIKDGVYKAKKNSIVQIKWCAPESISHGLFNYKSDVWSFGILLYEIVTGGKTPYPDKDNSEILTWLQSGNRMTKPLTCSGELYGIMMECWALKEEKRPDFRELHEKLRSLFTVDTGYEIIGESRGGYLTPLGQFVAQFNFEAQEMDQLSFEKGEHFKVLKSEEEWWYVESVKTSKRGYVPDNYIAPELQTILSLVEHKLWFVGTMEKFKVKKLLTAEGNDDGTFLVRERTRHKGELELCVLYSTAAGRDVSHYPIMCNSADRFHIEDGRDFSNIAELIDYYKNNAGVLICPLDRGTDDDYAPLPASLGRGVFDVDRSSIELGEFVTNGNFGNLYKGRLKGREVAVKKMIKGAMDPVEFLREANRMKNLRHKNILALLAVVPDPNDIMIVTEFMSNGDLLNYFRKGEGRFTGIADHVEIASQVASGMCYLEKQKMIHRDLRAANVLVGKRGTTKIADFGLARLIKENVYIASTDMFPVKWTSPEAIKNRIFSIKSDVWSFGILLYEIVTRGGVPFAGLPWETIERNIHEGIVMRQPDKCPDELYDVMRRCWNLEPKQRPSFWTLENEFTDFIYSRTK